MLMIIWFYTRWWYSDGLKWSWSRAITDRTKRCLEFFSVTSLLQTLFSPFKQTAVNSDARTIGEQFRAFIDRLISRIIGSIVRTIVIFAGVVSTIFVLASGLIFMLLWMVLPFSIFIAILFFALGVFV